MAAATIVRIGPPTIAMSPMLAPAADSASLTTAGGAGGAFVQLVRKSVKRFVPAVRQFPGLSAQIQTCCAMHVSRQYAMQGSVLAVGAIVGILLGALVGLYVSPKLVGETEGETVGGLVGVMVGVLVG